MRLEPRSTTSFDLRSGSAMGTPIKQPSDEPEQVGPEVGAFAT